MKPVVLVTGSSRGIGARIAREFALCGHPVAINYYQNEEKAMSLAQELIDRGCTVWTYGCDVSDAAQVRTMFDAVQKDLGAVDILINNAGIASIQLFSNISQQEWDRMFAVNVRGMFHCIQAALPHMIQQKSGRIVNIASIWGITGASCEAHYSATKAAVIGLTKALAKEVGPSGISVNCVAPGAIRTDMLADLPPDAIQRLEAEIPMGVIGDPLDIAGAVLFLAGNEADFMTGQVISPNGGYVI